MTEAEMVMLLRRRYGRVYTGNGGNPKYVHAAQVRDRLFDGRSCDFLAMDCSDMRGNELHGHEVKVTRSDWRRELAQPWKCEAFLPYVDYWWLVVSERAIVADGELPDNWGLMAPARNGRGLQVHVPARRLACNPLPRPILASFIRRAAAQMAPVMAAADGWAQAR
jgi:hypothetical protein